MKKLHNIIYLLVLLLFIFIINIFSLVNVNVNYKLGINIILLVNIILYIICITSVNLTFRKYDLTKKFKDNIKDAISNSFFISSVICIALSILIYSLSNFINLNTGLINYISFASKIWFVSAPFIGLEITIFRYFKEINYFKIPVILVISKLLIFLLITFLLYFKYPSNCIIYAKPACDILFIFYYSKTCFGLSLRK